MRFSPLNDIAVHILEKIATSLDLDLEGPVH